MKLIKALAASGGTRLTTPNHRLEGLAMMIRIRGRQASIVRFFAVALLIIAVFPTVSFAEEPVNFWADLGEQERLTVEANIVGPQTFRTYWLDQQQLEAALNQVPMEFSSAEPEIISLPMPDGTFVSVQIEESPILSPELQEANPDVRTYRVIGVDDPTATGRVDYTSSGFHAMLISESGTVFVDPAEDGDLAHYISYDENDVTPTSFECGTHGSSEDFLISEDFSNRTAAFPATNPSGDQLRTYRLAMSATGEYTQVFGGTLVAAQNAITTSINRVTGIYEREFAIRLNIVAFNIYTDGTTDPFTNNNPSVMLGQNQADLDANVGSANYDIGHVFGTRVGGFSGVASLGVVCTANQKARGVSTSSNVVGDGFDVRLVSHEIGHQFDADHTWNGTTGSCASAGQWQAGSAYEPASGSTIMSYAGICAGQNVQGQQDDYFHTRSFDQVTAYRDGAGACGSVANTGNTPPTVEAGPDCTIPTSTPFTLTAMGDDADLDPLTYTWEQFDLGTQDGNPQSTFVTGPLFRSREGTSDESRDFPRFADILSGAPTPYEVLPSVNRTLNFRVTARDNQPNGGGVDYDSMVVTVNGGPFAITAPTAGATLECGATETVSWTVGGGSVAPNVEFLLSSDGGTSFSSLVASTANDGSHNISMPQNLTSGAGRIMLEPSAECFFAVSEEFSIVDTTDPTLTAPDDIVVECTSPDGQVVPLGSPLVDDLCDSNVSVSNDAPALFPLGETTVKWTAIDDSSNSAMDNQLVTVEDTTRPIVECNNQPTIIPPDAPISFTATATDICNSQPVVEITGYDCFMFNGSGRRVDKRQSCDVRISGDTITIDDSGGVGNNIAWTVVATDGSGNETTEQCGTVVVKP